MKRFVLSHIAIFVAVFGALALLGPLTVSADETTEAQESGQTDQSLLPDVINSSPMPEDEAMPAVTLGDYEPGLERASDLLEQNFAQFLERDELGFDDELIDLLTRDIGYLYTGAVDIVRDPGRLDPNALLDLTLALIVIALFLILFFLIDRQITGLAHRIQAKTHFDISAWLTTAFRKLILVVGRGLVFLILILLSFFPIRATFGAVGWTLLLTDILLLLLVYRVTKTALVTVLRLHPRDLETQKHFAQLERFSLTALRITLGFLIGLAALEHFQYHEQVTAFVSFVFRLLLAILPIYLFWTRDAVLSLLPPRESSRLYRTFHGILARNYYTVLAITVLLLLFNAAGYINAASFLLTRGYALIVIGAIWFATLERFHHHVAAQAEEAEEASEVPSPLLKSVEQWLMTLGSLIVAVFSLKLIGLYAPLLALLQIPLVSIGHLHISLLSLVNVGLIVVGTVLSLRLFKALLNAKIYPAFGVDIGVAYALNTLLNYALVVVAFVLCLIALGVQLSAVMVVLASLGVGIGFGLQNIAENMISGFILLFGRAVKKGDFITVNELYGRVEAVGARSVVVRTPDNFSMLIPSKEIVSGRIVNWTFQDSIVRIHIPVGVSYDSDPGEVRQILYDTAVDHPDILDEPEPDVWIVEFGDSSIQFELLVYFDCRLTNQKALTGKFNFLIWQALQESEIEIPYPQRDLHLRSMGDDVDMTGPASSGGEDSTSE